MFNLKLISFRLWTATEQSIVHVLFLLYDFINLKSCWFQLLICKAIQTHLYIIIYIRSNAKRVYPLYVTFLILHR